MSIEYKRTWVIIVIALLFSVVFATQQTLPTAAQGQPNLLTNPGFEGGHYNQDGISEITVPNGWRMYYLDNVTFPGTGDLPAYRPETVVWNGQGGAAIPTGEEIFWRDGNFTLKIFKGWAPMYAALSQDVSGLQVGRRYRFVVPIYPDLVADYVDGKKIAPWQQDSGQVRLGASPVGASWRDETTIAYSGWWTAQSIPNFYLNMNVYVYDFTATAESMTVWVEVAGREPLPNNGFFLDGLSLTALDEVDNTVVAAVPVDPNAPTATPFPTPTPRPDGAIVHVVQTGDTFWSIAIRYAPALGTTPEDSLTIIQERNNNPAFINVGQELVILEAGAAPVAASETTTEETTEETTTEETAVEETVVEETASEETTSETTEEGSEESVTEEEEGRGEAATSEESAVEAQPETIAVAAQGGGTDAPQTAMGSVCITAFDDQSGDGVRDTAVEGSLSNAALTLTRGGATVATYVSDGVNENHCFEDLEPDTYQIQFFPPADYVPTTQDNGWISLSAGMVVPIVFGAQYDPVAVVAVTDAATTADPLVVENAATLETDSEGGLAANIGTIILGIAVFLVVLAGIGVLLLRRA